MKLAYQQLDNHLNKTLAPLYLLSGDEILLIQEATDAIRASALQAGYLERVSVAAEPGSDWGRALHTEIHNLSLFSNQRLIECHLGSAKPNAAAGKILQSIAAHLPAATIILISMQKLDSKAEQSAWYKALASVGVAIPIWPITLEQLPAWIMQRAKKSGISITLNAAKLLADNVEGNLLAAAQEIEKLCLLQPSGTIDVKEIEHTATDNARFDIFNLVECALTGNSQRCVRILENLRAEGIEPTLVLWALTRELRMLADMSLQMQHGTPLASLFSNYRIWEKRQAGVRRFLQQHTVQNCWKLMAHSAKIDRTIKGAMAGNVWDELTQLTLNIAGNVIILM